MKKSKAQKAIFLSPHSVEECHRRLKESVETSFFPYFSSKKVTGRVSREFISISKKIIYMNSFQTVFRASLKSSGEGTELIGTFDLHPFVKIFMYFWLGFLFLVGGTIFIFTLYSFVIKKAPIDIDLIMGILIPSGMALFGVALLFVGKWFASDESAFIKSFLDDLLDAKESSVVEQPSGAYSV